MSKRKNRAHARAFTLIELLVVIAVILILARLLLPSLDLARKRALEIICTNNLHQIGVAFNVYTTDRRNFPSHHLNGGDTNNLWMPALLPYVSNSWKVFLCPFGQAEAAMQCSAANYAAFPNPWKPGEVMNRDRWASYGYNEWGTSEGTRCGFGGHHQESSCCRAVSKVKGSSDLFLVGDANSDCVWDTALDGNDNNPTERPSARHRGGAYIVHRDGHVDWHRQNATINPAYGGTDAQWALRWNVNNKNTDPCGE